MSNNKNVDKLVLKMIVLLVLSVSEVLGYYCDHNYCSAEEFCCGDNLCCDYTNSVLFYSVIIIIAIVITIFILWAFFRIFFFYNNSFFIHFAKKFGHLFFSTDINNQIDHKVINISSNLFYILYFRNFCV